MKPRKKYLAAIAAIIFLPQLSSGQKITFWHRPSVMNQFQVEHTAAGVLVPSEYYSLAHPEYVKRAHATALSVYRVPVEFSISDQIANAEAVDSALNSRKRIEIENTVDMQVNDAKAIAMPAIQRKLEVYESLLTQMLLFEISQDTKNYYNEIRECILYDIKVLDKTQLPNSKRMEHYAQLGKSIDIATKSLSRLLRSFPRNLNKEPLPATKLKRSSARLEASVLNAEANWLTAVYKTSENGDIKGSTDRNISTNKK